MTTAVILAAGTATRLRPLTNNIPKCLLKVGGKSLLQRNLESLKDNCIQRVVIVTGFLEEMIHAAVRSMNLGLEVEFITNPAYDQTNNNHSLWLARPAVSGHDIVLLDADILFDRRILSHLLASTHDDALVIRRSDSLGHEEIKCELDANDAVLHIGKHLDPRTSAGESLGIEKFSAHTSTKLFDVLSRRHVINEFYEASFQEVIDAGATIYAVDSRGLPCAEIDTPDDLQHADELAKKLT
ncbi:MAG: phosphocholine cytidylyltransferase family protein [Ignavibacteriae bacterium]|nr:phosphocholine cytidylyltransferase family protein [Ignavibacteriota bacterium]